MVIKHMSTQGHQAFEAPKIWHPHMLNSLVSRGHRTTHIWAVSLTDTAMAQNTTSSTI